MQVFDLRKEQAWNTKTNGEKILGEVEEGDVTVACWEPGQISPYHCHPNATEIYFCFEGGGRMKTPEGIVDVAPGSFGVHPPGELHEWITGPARTLLFRVRYGSEMSARTKKGPSTPDWQPPPADTEYFKAE